MSVKRTRLIGSQRDAKSVAKRYYPWQFRPPRDIPHQGERMSGRRSLPSLVLLLTLAEK